MLKGIKTTVLSIFMVMFISQFATAVPPNNYDIRGSVEQVRYLTMTDGGGDLLISIYFQSGYTDNISCVDSDGRVIISSRSKYLDKEDVRVIFDFALATKSANQKLNLAGAGCNDLNSVWMSP